MADTRGHRSHPETPLVEWIVAACGAAMILAVMGFLVYRAVTVPHTPAAIRVEITQVISTPAGFLVSFVATNHGEENAARVTIEGRVRSGDGEVDQAQTTLDYVPAHSTARGGLYFRSDPRTATLEVRALGYARP